MFFSSKPKGFFVEVTDHAVTLARTSSPVAPMVIEELRRCPVGDEGALSEALAVIQPKNNPSGFLNACCATYPAKRFIRRASLELKRLKEPAYLPELFSTQFRVDPEKYTIHIINAVDGSDYDFANAVQKDVLFCGLPSDDVVAVQDQLLSSGFFPDALELGTVSVLGGLVDYLAFTKSKAPTLVLEVGTDTTHTYIVSAAGVEASRLIPQGLDAMIPIVQKELNLKDEESAKKLFYSNTFNFTGMGPLLVKRLLKELQSSIGFYEVQTGQSVSQVLCTLVPEKLGWLEGAIAGALGISATKLDLAPWLQARQVTIADGALKGPLDASWLGLVSLMGNKPIDSNAVAPAKKD
ncbi:MAG: hypothetical protein JSR48_00870 [Verrucomicrobia bacterium]|nr:hypothetical protein [Verrucomicrobiota bacterium]